MEPREDRDLGLRRANAATLLAMALPGSVYLTKVRSSVCRRSPTSPATTARIPRSSAPESQEIGRDGCRVPLPWTADGPSFGFGAGGAHLPQPAWFAEFAVDTQSGRSGSVLSLYQDALAGRRMLQTDERLEWLDIAPDVVAFRRPNGWTSATNFGSHSVTLEAERVYLFSDGSVPTDGPGVSNRHHRLVPAWLRRHSSRRTPTSRRPRFTRCIHGRSPPMEASGRVTAELERISALGADILYLTPVQRSVASAASDQSEARYAIQDYRRIDPEQGTDGDFDEW